jgi:hypothetical protein
MKTVAFFGDSFVGKKEGWIEYFSLHNDYQIEHIGKTGGDYIYALEKWDRVNRNQKLIDLCVYAHTHTSRLYHPDPLVPLTSGVVAGMLEGKFRDSKLDKNDPVIQAAMNYYLYLDFPSAASIRNTALIMGADRFIKENNVSFVKIIHLWSFAPHRVNNDEVLQQEVGWPFEMHTGVNVKLDLCNLSRVEPGFVDEEFDPRPLHFSPFAYQFMSDLIMVASKADDGTVIDFSHVSTKSKWRDYVDILETYKSKFL